MVSSESQEKVKNSISRLALLGARTLLGAKGIATRSKAKASSFHWTIEDGFPVCVAYLHMCVLHAHGFTMPEHSHAPRQYYTYMHVYVYVYTIYGAMYMRS